MRVAWRGLRRSWNQASAPYSPSRSAIWCPSPKCSPRGCVISNRCSLAAKFRIFAKASDSSPQFPTYFRWRTNCLVSPSNGEAPEGACLNSRHLYCGNAVPFLGLARHSQDQHEGGEIPNLCSSSRSDPGGRGRIFPGCLVRSHRPSPEVGVIKMTTRKGETPQVRSVVIAFAFWLILFVGPARADQVQYSVDINTSVIQRHFRATRLRFPSPAALKQVVCKEPHICAKSFWPDGFRRQHAGE